MSDSDYGPWIEHDGASPRGLFNGARVQVAYDTNFAAVLPTKGEGLSSNWPGFYWRFKPTRVGWFRSKVIRVCDQSEFAPILRYRIRKDPAVELMKTKAAALDKLNPKVLA